MIDLTIFPEWKAVAAHQRIVADLHLRELFATNPGRAESMTVTAADLVIDFSKHRISRTGIRAIIAMLPGILRLSATPFVCPGH